MNYLHHRRMRPLAVTLICLAGLATSGLAENAALFEIRSGGLKKAAANRVEKKTVKSVHSVQVSPEALVGDILDLSLPSGEKKAFRKKELRFDEAGYAIWVGARLENPVETATIVSRDGKINASFHIQGRTFTLQPAGERGEHVLLERDFKEMNECATK